MTLCWRVTSGGHGKLSYLDVPQTFEVFHYIPTDERFSTDQWDRGACFSFQIICKKRMWDQILIAADFYEIIHAFLFIRASIFWLSLRSFLFSGFVSRNLEGEMFLNMLTFLHLELMRQACHNISISFQIICKKRKFGRWSTDCCADLYDLTQAFLLFAFLLCS